MIEDGLFVDDNSRQHDRSTLNQSGINTSVDPTVTYPFVHTCMSFNSVQDISRHQKCVMCMAEGRKKATYIYCGFCTNTSHREIDRHSSRHAYCMGCKYQCFQRHMANCFVNKLKNDSTLTQLIIAKQPRVTTVAGPHKTSF